MPSFTVKVKWGKELFKDVELNTDEEPVVFRAQLFALTGVQPDRQKIMLKGMTLKPDSWDNVKLKDGITLLMMGSKEEDIAQVPAERTKFVEDMTDSELATALEMPAGLTNLGNTCYMNATVQCLKSVPELAEGLKQFKSNYGAEGGYAQAVTSALRDLYSSMENVASVPPIIMLNVLHTAFPRFAERGEQGGFQQQDANECWTELVRMLQEKLKPRQEQGPDGQMVPSKYGSLIDQYFGGVFSSELKCVESDEEPVTRSTEKFLQLSCFISQDVKYLHTGLKLRLQEQLTKRSALLDRDAAYSKTSRISRLPAYLTVQLVRFFYKEKEGVNAKILKDVKFPMLLDVYELCSEELQQKLLPMRTHFKAWEDLKAEEARVPANKAATAPADKKEEVACVPFSFEDDMGSNNSGFYELQAVLTHQGRSSSSGHYVGWVKLATGWVKFDDDTVTPVEEADILKLSGGGDWHCAYVLLYGPRRLPVEALEKVKAAAAAAATTATAAPSGDSGEKMEQ
ncbi:Ubiquitin carboxyl-terminal hydrolase 14 [Amphibalanus amphitrite]|uniref:Ubiquitin carboxyl-terminal hydrolase n=1 Tax=Amphibalanus amphitrite TaxID=1232801 RepID=A0A6A4WZA0_AMPAM|nr:ubiquitin carboxyl-terminal hydrolase 14-like [Amphibalanus amphitrite]XP_043241346.1 ubiquitin carboxyl-terminal hydrolase 14-like [Amphibalanus amphitrite]XP_043241347.1 ubiquitin carboxyl-terminal hydrolase 14-like [Amphibalanus amphitrite]XP_043241348.1 ubiquitin carboxyl-terminal hydrolase 14-like [Amphibalanus amphitrite]XP_043241349.1 ubiquitin carboxyl-terminal hydrolase 14-like [Amphibalanus amphitrite]XP_043241350.1 ubiquitin carboxyl-terminal hydrolase 14-like [Amphibalanus amphi